MSLGEKLAALPKKEPIYIENTTGKKGYMGVANKKGENTLEYQKIGPAFPGGSFIRMAAEPDGNCFFNSFLLLNISLNEIFCEKPDSEDQLSPDSIICNSEAFKPPNLFKFCSKIIGSVT
jgi:hypothetical protein